MTVWFGSTLFDKLFLSYFGIQGHNSIYQLPQAKWCIQHIREVWYEPLLLKHTIYGPEIKRFYRQKMKAVHSLQGFTNYFEHAHSNHISNIKNMVIYLIIRTLKNIFLLFESKTGKKIIVRNTWKSKRGTWSSVSVWTSHKNTLYHLYHMRSWKTNQHAHLISLNDPQIHPSGKNNKRGKMALNRSPEVKAVIVQITLLAFLFIGVEQF